MSEKFFNLKKNNYLVKKSESKFTSKDLLHCSTSKARGKLSYELAIKHKVLPISIINRKDNNLLILASNNNALDLIEKLKFITESEIKLIQINSDVLLDGIFKAYHYNEDKLVESVKNFDKDFKIKDEVFNLRDKKGYIIEFLSNLIDFAISHEASDIHLVPLFDGASVKLRINNIIHEHEENFCSKKVYSEIVNLIKILSKLNTTIHSESQDGSFKIKVNNSYISLRVGVMPNIHGERIALRLLGVNQKLNFDDLGFNKQISNLINDFISKDEGLLLFSGSTGSGKSTSIYSILKKLTLKSKNIISIEDPVELELPGVSQTSISEKYSFIDAFKASLRQDPDVIMLGEIRDYESAKIALQASLSGHLIISTIHAKNVFLVKERFESLGINNNLFSQSNNLIISQKLIPKLCKCKVIDLTKTNHYKFDCYKAIGCKLCDYSGFSKKVLISEALKLDLFKNINNIEEFKSKNIGKNYFSCEDQMKELIKLGKIIAF